PISSPTLQSSQQYSIQNNFSGVVNFYGSGFNPKDMQSPIQNAFPYPASQQAKPWKRIKPVLSDSDDE
ncbi:hypothetical protein AC249_AIPGENE19165, partial [Exaiptasia diaphana]